MNWRTRAVGWLVGGVVGVGGTAAGQAPPAPAPNGLVLPSTDAFLAPPPAAMTPAQPEASVAGGGGTRLEGPLGDGIGPNIPYPAGDPKPADVPLKGVWKRGLFFEGGDDHDFSLFVGGRVHLDMANYAAPTGLRANVPGTNPLEDGVSFRRVRIDLGGTIYKTIDYFVQADMVNAFLTDQGSNRAADVPVFTDLWFTFKDLPYLGNLRVGNQKPPLAFEHLTSSRFLNFIERSLGFDAFVEVFANGFQPGVLAFDTYADKRGTWAAGVFKNTRSIFPYNVGDGEHEFDGRITYLPVWADGGRKVVHVGLGASTRQLDEWQQRFRARMDVRNSPSAVSPLLADTGLLNGTAQRLLIPELVAVNGPWSFQAEYYASWMNNVGIPVGSKVYPQGQIYLQSAYVEAHYFLTGEVRDYDRDKAVFGRVVPKSPFKWSRSGVTGWGAWQAAARYSYLDLDDKAVRGGTIHDMTLGLNWFLNPNAKLQLNYSLAHRHVMDPAGDGWINALGTRLAWDF